MKSLVVGMGFGQLYKDVLIGMGAEVITVDPFRVADFTSVGLAIAAHGQFDTVNICVPNHLHEEIARAVGPHSKIVFVEKPGLRTSQDWIKLVEDIPQTRFMMVKNNQYRAEIKRFAAQLNQSTSVNIQWDNKNRIPNPGSWFTDKSKAFGGVSRDLIPHMLSYYCALTDWRKGTGTFASATQYHQLADIIDSDYGTVNHEGVYDVDDYCLLEYTTSNNVTWKLGADWKTNTVDDIGISFGGKNSAIRFELGLCPEEAYQTMIATAWDNINNEEFWTEQFDQDVWIHQQIENL